MKRIGWFLPVIAVILLSSCSSMNYLSQNSYKVQGSMKVPYLMDVLEKPKITPPAVKLSNIQKDLVIDETLIDSNLLTELDQAINNILIEARTYIGTPYRYGGTTRRGIDCSAFMQKAFLAEGIDLPRVSSQQAKIGYPIPKDKIKAGDLIFFSTTSRTRVTHVGLAVNVDDFGNVRFIHASSSKGVTISSLDESYWNSRFRTARRVNYISNGPAMAMHTVLNSGLKDSLN